MQEITIDRGQLRLISEAFLNISRQRFEYTLNDIQDSPADFLKALPMFLHINHPHFPGYTTEHVPCGFPKYTPSKEIEKLLSKWSRTSKKKMKKESSSKKLLGLYLVGDTGSLTFHPSHLITVWVLHKPLPDAEITALQEKLSLIELEARKQKLHLSFTLIEPLKTILPPLTLDHFYSAAIYLAGCTPVWWSIPADQQDNYATLAEMLLTQRFLDPQAVCDLGPVPKPPLVEYLNKALPLFEKALTNPYPYLLDLWSLEYLSSTPEPALWSTAFKQTVYTLSENLPVDPALYRLNLLTTHLLEKKATDRLEFLRKSVYIHSYSKRSSQRKKVLETLTKDWGWDDDKKRQLQQHADWKTEMVLPEYQTLLHECEIYYRFLHQLQLKVSAEQSAPYAQQEMITLGRMLYSRFDTRAGKINRIYPGISKNMQEQELYVQEEDKLWLLKRGTQLLKKADSLIALTAWMLLNAVYQSGTRVLLKSTEEKLTPHTFTLCCNQLLHHLNLPLETERAAFLKPASITEVFTLLSISDETSEDPLANIRTLSEITINSWGEVFTQAYTEKNAFLQWIQSSLKKRITAFKPKKSTPLCKTLSFDDTLTPLLVETFERFQEELFTHFTKHPYAETLRYIFQMNKTLILCKAEKKEITLSSFHSQQALLQTLQKPQPDYSPVLFHPSLEKTAIVPALCNAAEKMPGDLLIFYLITEKEIKLYFIDERGSLFFDQGAASIAAMLIRNYREFLETLMIEKQLAGQKVSYTVRFFQVQHNTQNTYIFTEKKPLLETAARPPITIDAKAFTGPTGVLLFDLQCNETHFSAAKEGLEAYEKAAKFLMEKRPSQSSYSFWINRLDLSALPLENRQQTLFYLRYKKEVESLLNATTSLRS